MKLPNWYLLTDLNDVDTQNHCNHVRTYENRSKQGILKWKQSQFPTLVVHLLIHLAVPIGRFSLPEGIAFWFVRKRYLCLYIWILLMQRICFLPVSYFATVKQKMFVISSGGHTLCAFSCQLYHCLPVFPSHFIFVSVADEWFIVANAMNVFFNLSNCLFPVFFKNVSQLIFEQHTATLTHVWD